MNATADNGNDPDHDADTGILDIIFTTGGMPILQILLIRSCHRIVRTGMSNYPKRTFNFCPNPDGIQ